MREFGHESGSYALRPAQTTTLSAIAPRQMNEAKALVADDEVVGDVGHDHQGDQDQVEPCTVIRAPVAGNSCRDSPLCRRKRSQAMKP